MARLCIWFGVLAFSGCGKAHTPVDSAVGTDAGQDTRREDIGSLDSGVEGGPLEPLPDCGATSAEELAACPERARYLDDLTSITGARPTGSDHWQEVQDLCAARFEELGFVVERQAYSSSGVNVIGTKVGTGPGEEIVTVGAHYDSTPGCPGADDNGTGVAGVLEAARVLATASYPRTLIVACWDEEELGLVGSGAFVEREQVLGKNFVANFNFEMIGFTSDEPDSQRLPGGFGVLFSESAAQLEARDNRGDFIALVGNLGALAQTESLARLAARVGLPAIRIDIPEGLENADLLADLRRSDHAQFWEAGFPAIMITDTSEFRYNRYHCRDGVDDLSTLNHDFATQVIQATVGAAAEALGL